MRANNKNWGISPKEKEEGFVPLFNGVDLSNWHVIGTNSWSVSDGIIVCSGDGRGWIRPEKEYEDFILRLEYKISPGGNSGIFIRTSEKGRPAFAGMEIQLLDDHGKEASKKSTGAIYAAMPPEKNVSKPAGEWNQVEITCKGPKVRVWMNGEEVVDVNLDEHPEELKDEKPPTPLKERLRKGYIGLQNHNSAVAFRNVRIKEL